MWLLVEYPNSDVRVLFECVVHRTISTDDVKRGWRKLGGRVVAIYRRKAVELPEYD